MSHPIWEPTKEQIKSANFQTYFKFLKEHNTLDFHDYQSLYDWSVNNIELFWKSIFDFSEIIHSSQENSILKSSSMFDSKWFVGAKLNFAENLLRHKNSQPAIVHIRENDHRQEITYDQLYNLTAQTASGLRKVGVKKNDRVAAFIPNIPEAVIGMLATTSIGALWSSCSPDFGIQGVFDRFSQIEPKILITTNCYYYNGKQIDLSEKIIAIADKIRSIEKIIVVNLGDTKGNLISKNILAWDDLLDKNSIELEFEQLPFDHPVYIMYSSGTTGKPKCIVHGAGGTLLQHFKEHYLHTNIKPDDNLFYFTTTGWMMWNWLVSGLQLGCTIILYDGSPFYPETKTLWKMAEDENISVFGTSPKFLSVCEAKKLEPSKECDLSNLRTILSTGSPLSDDNFEYVSNSIGKSIQLASISGGTDIISCFMLGNPILPVHKGEIQSRGLGMKVETFDDNGKPIYDQVGELVCTAPFPSMPVSFWNDPNGIKYKKTYFEHFENVWRHGDYIRITENHGVIVYGRSDATLNPGGVRIGTAEIYSPVEAMNEISDSIVVGHQIGTDTEVILFVILENSYELTKELTQKIKQTIREKTSPRHVPSKIYQVTDIPRTINGKKVELAVSKMLSGNEIQNLDSIANPESLEQFKSILSRN